MNEIRSLSKEAKEIELGVILRFYDDVCAKAEELMQESGKLEGMHFAAMRLIINQKMRELALIE